MSVDRFREAAALLRERAGTVRRPYAPEDRIDLALADWLDLAADDHDARCPGDCPATRAVDAILGGDR